MVIVLLSLFFFVTKFYFQFQNNVGSTPDCQSKDFHRGCPTQKVHNDTRVADPGCFPRITDPKFSYPRSRIQIFFITDPDTPPPSPREWASKNLSILTQKNCFQVLGNMIRVVHPGSRSRFFYPYWIQGSKRHRIPDQDPQHWMIL